MGIVTDYPFWFILICLLTGGAYSFFLYFRTKNGELEPWLVWVMAILRFTSVFFISFLLLSPLIKRTTEIVDKPIIVVAQDNSESILLSKDSVFYKSEYRVKLDQLVNRLSKKYDVVFSSFGSSVENSLKSTFDEKSTDISSFFSDFTSRYSNRNTGAIILLSDGIFNKGSNPLYPANKINCPIYTVALGDTLTRKDLIIKKVICNKTAFLGDKFPVEIQIEANECGGERSELSIMNGAQVIEKRSIAFPNNRTFIKLTFVIDAKEKRMHHYSIMMTPLEKEINRFNNQTEIFVDVIDAKQKIALLYVSPHPDITAIRQAIETTAKYDLVVEKISDFRDAPAGYDLIILYQLPSLAGIDNISQIMSAKTSLLFILGAQSDLNTFNNLKTGLQVLSSKSSVIETLPSFNPDFSLFTTDKDI
ncbi:MAG: hypothetical protein WCL00_09890, partial [Bacteroidota bacterium]